MTNVHPHTQRAAAARAVILARLLDTAVEEQATPEVLAFHAFIPSLRCVKYADNGGLWVMLQIPGEQVEETYPLVRQYVGRPLLVSLEPINLEDIDA